MRIHLTPEWCMAMATREGDHSVGVGPRAAEHSPEAQASIEHALGDPESRIAFGRLVQLMRRKQGLTIEGLAARAMVDIGELVRIEGDNHHVPEPRTVFVLAKTFGLPRQPFVQLAGLATARDTRLREEAVKFAARSDSVEALTAEERDALEHFIRVLSERADRDDQRGK